MIKAGGYIYIKARFDDTFPNEDRIEEIIEENIEDYLDNLEITDIDVTDFETISKEWATCDEVMDAMRERDWERGEE